MIFSFISVSNPSIIESVKISDATPIAIPAILKTEIKEMNPIFLCENRWRRAMKNSIAKVILPVLIKETG